MPPARTSLSNSIRARNRLVEGHLGLVRLVSGRLRGRCDCAGEDLFQEGCLGLIKAAEGFDRGRGAAISSYAVGKIRGEILHYLRDRHHLVKSPWRRRDLHARGMRLLALWSHEGRRNRSGPAVAEALGCRLDEWQEACRLHLALQVRSLDQPLRAGADGDGGGEATLLEQLPDPRSLAEENGTGGGVVPAAGATPEAALLAALDPGSRRLLEGRFVDGLSWSALGAELGLPARGARRRCLALRDELRRRRDAAAPSPAAPPPPSAGR
jgi:RNA polymerase sigma-B factor